MGTKNFNEKFDFEYKSKVSLQHLDDLQYVRVRLPVSEVPTRNIFRAIIAASLMLDKYMFISNSHNHPACKNYMLRNSEGFSLNKTSNVYSLKTASLIFGEMEYEGKKYFGFEVMAKKGSNFSLLTEKMAEELMHQENTAYSSTSINAAIHISHISSN